MNNPNKSWNTSSKPVKNYPFEVEAIPKIYNGLLDIINRRIKPPTRAAVFVMFVTRIFVIDLIIRIIASCPYQL